MPVLNEVETIDRSLESVNQQTLSPGTVWVADGGSHDGTLEHLENWKNHLPIQVIDNPRKRQAPGLNLMLEKSDAEFVARLDGHTYWSKNYLETLVNRLKDDATFGAAGGLVQLAEEASSFQHNVWSFMCHVLGTGGPAYRTRNEEGGLVETIQSPVYRRESLRFAGNFREDLPWAEDDELHRRLREAGHKLYLQPEAKLYYLPRPRFRDVFIQMNHYGQGRGRLGKEGIFPTRRHRIIERLLLIWTFGMVWNPIGWGIGIFYAMFLPIIVFHEWMENRGGWPLLLLFPGGQLVYWLGWLRGRFSPNCSVKE